VNLGDLIFVVAHKSGLSDDNSDEHTLMLKWARDGVVEVLLETSCVIDTATTTLQPNYYLYTIDPAVLAVKAAQLQSQSQLYDIEVTQLERLRTAQRAQGTSPIQLLAVEGDRLYVYPTPTAPDVIVWDYIPRPQQQLTNPADDPSATQFGRIPTEYHRAIEYYMIWQAAEYDDKKFAESPQDLMGRFTQECSRVNRRRKGKRGRTPFRPLVGYPGRQSMPSRNDQDRVLYG
jgi:hypothetical protein